MVCKDLAAASKKGLGVWAGARKTSAEVPVFAALQWMRARRQQTLSEVTSSQAIGIGLRGESEVTTGRTAPMAPEGIQLPVV